MGAEGTSAFGGFGPFESLLPLAGAAALGTAAEGNGGGATTTGEAEKETRGRPAGARTGLDTKLVSSKSVGSVVGATLARVLAALTSGDAEPCTGRGAMSASVKRAVFDRRRGADGLCAPIVLTAAALMGRAGSVMARGMGAKSGMESAYDGVAASILGVECAELPLLLALLGTGWAANGPDDVGAIVNELARDCDEDDAVGWLSVAGMAGTGGMPGLDGGTPGLVSGALF